MDDVFQQFYESCVMQTAIIINSNRINSDQSQFKIWIYSNTQREHSPLEMHGCALKAERWFK